jgi:hypothetical protein
VSKEEKQQRHEWAMKQIDKGVGFSELASIVAVNCFLPPLIRNRHKMGDGYSPASILLIARVPLTFIL